KKAINKLQYDEIISFINGVIKNKEIHIKNRVKMSGMIIVQEGNNKKVYIIAPNSKEIDIIEKTLQEIIKNE
ncbi:MAG: hypothetical protein ACFFBD_29530, partial [Candidatus Hodarchaeota archaeon]